MLTKAGKSHNSLVHAPSGRLWLSLFHRIPKGQMIHIPILAGNTDTEIWGEDTGEFKYVKSTNR
jgi:hypothetical protein